MQALNASQIHSLVGGGHALERYTGVVRDTKDLEIFVQREQLDNVFEAVGKLGYHAKLCFPHWLGKICSGERFVDIIFNSENGICSVDDDWFKYAIDVELFKIPIQLCPVEEMIWSKAFVMERERYDGADIAHLIRAYGERMDWRRLLDRFDVHWRVLFSWTILFGYIYPSDGSSIPTWVMHDLLTRRHSERGYRDARQLPTGPMTTQDAAQWTAAGTDQARRPASS